MRCDALDYSVNHLLVLVGSGWLHDLPGTSPRSYLFNVVLMRGTCTSMIPPTISNSPSSVSPCGVQVLLLTLPAWPHVPWTLPVGLLQQRRHPIASSTQRRKWSTLTRLSNDTARKSRSSRLRRAIHRRRRPWMPTRTTPSTLPPGAITIASRTMLNTLGVTTARRTLRTPATPQATSTITTATTSIVSPLFFSL